IALPRWVINASLASLALVGVAVSFGLAVAAGLAGESLLKGRVYPGLERGLFLGVIPVAAALFGWWCQRRQLRRGLVIGMAGAALLFSGSVGAWASVALDMYKAPRFLCGLLPADHGQQDIRIGCFGYYQPSLVYY